MISICVVNKNRTNNLINYVISSMNEVYGKENIELSLFDFGSTDIDNFNKTIKSKWSGKLVLSIEEKPFHKTYGLNKVAEQVTSDKLFFCDADMTLPKTFVEDFEARVKPGQAWFPVCFSLYENKPKIITKENGWWRVAGFGMAGVYKKDFFNVGAHNIKFRWWGGEDEELYKRLLKKGFKIVRDQYSGLFHNWHPQDNNDDWHANRNIFYYNNYKDTKLYKRRK